MTEICTNRFGKIKVASSDLLHFPQGLVGFERCRQWVLLADSANSAVGWLQSASQSAVAMAVISPRRFLPEYRFHLQPEQLRQIELEDLDRAFVLNVVAKSNGKLTANLKAPVVVNLDRRLGCQVVAADDHPLQHTLEPRGPQLRKIA